MDLTKGYALDEVGELVPPGLSRHVYDWNCLMGEALPSWLVTPAASGAASTGTAYASDAHDLTHPGYFRINGGSTIDNLARLSTVGIPLNQYAAVMFQCFGVQFDSSNAASADMDATISFGIHNQTAISATNAGARVIQRGATALVITASITGAPTGGTFKLAVSVDGGAAQETTALAYNATAGSVQNALRALANIGGTNMTVTGSNGGPYTITPAGAIASSDVVITLTDNGLTGGTSPSVTPVSTRDSSARFLIPGAAGDFAPFGATFRTKREQYRFRNMGFLLYRSGQAVYFEDDPATPVGTLDASGLMGSGLVSGAIYIQTKTATDKPLRLGGARLTLWREPLTL